MIATRLALLLSVALPVTLCPTARAQDASATTGGQESAPAADAVANDEIVVTANRYGEATVAAETEFSDGEIASHGTDSIGTLLERLGPFIDPAGQQPVVLINGRPADGDRAILSYPAEALNRLQVLRPEAAAQYGYPPDRRVVNLVLKPHFSSLTTDAAISAATRGGQYGSDLSIGRVAIDGPVRWNAQARLDRDSALLKSARNIPPVAGTFDSVGFVTGAGGSGIDPALSLAAGWPVTIAALPPVAMLQPPALADFVTTAGSAHRVDPNDFETLQPSRRRLSVGIGITRPIGDFSVSLGVNASSNASEGLRGLPMVSSLVPAGSPWSPFSGDVFLTRPFSGTRPLRNDNSSSSFGVTLAASGRIDGWETALSAGYARSSSDSLLERGIDAAWAQALIDSADPAFNPYGPLSDRFLQASRNRTRAENFDIRATAGKAIVDFPAGPLTASFAAAAGRSVTESEGSEGLSSPFAARRQASGLMMVGVPLSRKDTGHLGDLSIELSLGGQAQSGSGLQSRLGGSVTWSPFSIVQLRGSLEYSETAPSYEQLDGVVVRGINRIFDYAREETSDVIWITGGNPNLGRGRRENRSLTIQLRPFGDQSLTLNLGYREQLATGSVVPFAELTPAIEAAFPDRVTRDATGRLIAIDARAINLGRDADAELRSGVALRLPVPRRPALGVARRPRNDTFQLTASLNHRWRLKSYIQTGPGVPVIDQLGDDGGLSRHFLSFQITAGKRGIGGSINGNWSSATNLRNRAFPDGSRDLISNPPAILNLAVFVEPEHLWRNAGTNGWTKNVRASIDIRNVLGGYRQITRSDGSVPPNYGRDQIDPLGRTISIAIRKRF